MSVKNIYRHAGVLGMVFISSAATAQLVGNAHAKEDIDKVLKSIPVKDKSIGYANLSERLPNLQITVERITSSPYTSEDVKLSQGTLRRGDIEYKFWMSEPNAVLKAMCPISRQFVMIKSRNKWIPADRTSNFLTTGYKGCVAP